MSLRHMLPTARRSAVRDALKATLGNKTQAAKALGVSRRTLHTYLGTMGVTPEEISGWVAEALAEARARTLGAL